MIPRKGKPFQLRIQNFSYTFVEPTAAVMRQGLLRAALPIKVGLL
jgi:hypothetical protein